MAERTDYVDASGERVLTVINLTPPEPVDCCICGKDTTDHYAVPYYCGPVREGKSEGGYKAACARCYARWEAWDSAHAEYESWLPIPAAGVSVDGERQRFEAWLRRRWPNAQTPIDEKTPTGYYLYSENNILWEAWQEATRCVTVPTPAPMPPGCKHPACDCPLRVCKAMAAPGVKEADHG